VFDVDFVGVAADGAVFGVVLFVAGGAVDGDDDLLAAGGADVGAFVLRLAASFLALLHADVLLKCAVTGLSW
jgi:hypothetical protein